MGPPHPKHPDGKTSHIWGVFPSMGSLPIHGKTSHVWEDFPYMGRLPMCGKTSHVWEDFPYMGSLPLCGKFSHTWEAFPCMGSLPIHRKSAHTWKEYPHNLGVPPLGGIEPVPVQTVKVLHSDGAALLQVGAARRPPHGRSRHAATFSEGQATPLMTLFNGTASQI